eukprot:TRINITY_DN1009_c0_g5_i1.p1 TRINITY_DN1009_c0_g5~~TRINITY_DN1009_c0_g5_i1.p1  ORF type:complete len:1247 (-),score=379.95 TRINITY_DN1009_c0_g5_i1:184-3825(-)
MSGERAHGSQKKRRRNRKWRPKATEESTPSPLPPPPLAPVVTKEEEEDDVGPETFVPEGFMHAVAQIPKKMEDHPDPKRVSQALKHIIEGHYTLSALEEEDLLVRIATVCRRKEYWSEEGLSKAVSEIIVTLIAKQKSMRLSPTDALDVTTFVFHQAAEELSPTTEMHEAIFHLRALAVLLNAHLPHIHSILKDVIALLLPVVMSIDFELHVRRLAISCIGNMCARADMDDPNIVSFIRGNISDIFETLVTTFVGLATSFVQEPARFKRIFYHSVRSLTHAVPHAARASIDTHDSVLLPLLRSVLFSLFGDAAHGMGASMHSESDRDPFSDAYMSDSIGFRHDFGVKSGSDSHSEMSVHGTRAGGGGGRGHDSGSDLVGACLRLLDAIAANNSKSLHPVWQILLPQRNATNPHTPSPSIISFMLFDSNHRNRMAAASCLKHMFDGARQFVSQADDRKSTTRARFTPLSRIIGSIIAEVHTSFVFGLQKERNIHVLRAMISALDTLVQNVPYDNLEGSYISDVMPLLLESLSSSESNLVEGVLSCIGHCFEAQKTIPEVEGMLRGTEVHGIVGRGRAPVEDIIRKTSFPCVEEVRFQAFVCLSRLALHYPFVLIALWPRVLQDVVRNGLDSGIPEFALSVLKMLENLVRFKRKSTRESSSLPSEIQTRTGRTAARRVSEKSSLGSSAMKKDKEKRPAGKPGSGKEALEGEGGEAEGEREGEREGEDDGSRGVSLSLFAGKGGVGDGDGNGDDAFAEDGRPKCVPLDIWKDILHSVLIKFWNDGGLRNAKSSAFSILSYMEEEIYLSLSDEEKSQIMDSLSKESKETGSSAAFSVLKVLGSFIFFECLSKDEKFLSIVHDSILFHARESSGNARLRLQNIWLVANLFDSLRARIVETTDKSSTENTSALVKFLDVLEFAISETKASEKVQANAIRAIGNFGSVLPWGLCVSKEHHIIHRIVGSFLHCVRSRQAKVQWNACYAIGSLLLRINEMSSEVESHGGVEEEWEEMRVAVLPCIDALCDLVVKDSNYKVRIHSASALNNEFVSKRFFGDRMVTLWQSVFGSMHRLQSVDEPSAKSFQEYQHISSLVDALDALAVRLIAMTTQDDCGDVGKIARMYPDAIRAFVGRLEAKGVETTSSSGFDDEEKYSSNTRGRDLSELNPESISRSDFESLSLSPVRSRLGGVYRCLAMLFAPDADETTLDWLQERLASIEK